MKTAEEVMQDVINGDEPENEGMNPSILMHRNIDHDKVEKYIVLTMYDHASGCDPITEHITNGWIVFRIQTELDWYGNLNTHHTKVYMAKMK